MKRQALFPLTALLALGCSAGGTGDSGAAVGSPPPGSLASGGNGGPGPSGSDPDFLLEGDELAYDGDGNPLNIGSEVACDGIDENGNGIIDDVDKGRDGLCDCLRIGFLGELASDAGNRTGAFQSWLEERSDIPVTLIPSTAALSPDSLAGLQVLVVGNMAQRASSGGYSPAEVSAFEQWIAVAGGGAITLAGYSNRENDVVPTNQLLAPAGLAYDYQGRGAGVLGVGAPPVLVRGIAAPEHPSMDNLTALGVYAAYPIVGDGEVIVREGEFTLAMAKQHGEGHVFAFAYEWITQDALWLPMTNVQLTPCQQGCRQCEMQCNACDQQCADCQLQPCEGGQAAPPEGETCRRGCDQGCESCGSNCSACESQCQACSAGEQRDVLDAGLCLVLLQYCIG
jgi:hypothetical protein